MAGGTRLKVKCNFALLVNDVPLREIPDKCNNRPLGLNQVVTWKNLLFFYCVTPPTYYPTYRHRDARVNFQCACISGLKLVDVSPISTAP